MNQEQYNIACKIYKSLGDKYARDDKYTDANDALQESYINEDFHSVYYIAGNLTQDEEVALSDCFITEFNATRKERNAALLKTKQGKVGLLIGGTVGLILGGVFGYLVFGRHITNSATTAWQKNLGYSSNPISYKLSRAMKDALYGIYSNKLHIYPFEPNISDTTLEALISSGLIRMNEYNDEYELTEEGLSIAKSESTLKEQARAKTRSLARARSSTMTGLGMKRTKYGWE